MVAGVLEMECRNSATKTGLPESVYLGGEAGPAKPEEMPETSRDGKNAKAFGHREGFTQWRRSSV